MIRPSVPPQLPVYTITLTGDDLSAVRDYSFDVLSALSKGVEPTRTDVLTREVNPHLLLAVLNQYVEAHNGSLIITQNAQRGASGRGRQPAISLEELEQAFYAQQKPSTAVDPAYIEQRAAEINADFDA